MPIPCRAVPTLLLAAALSVAAGCATRVPTHSPRISPTEEHLAAKSDADCAACHGPSSLPRDHAAKDPCRRCHKICHGRNE
jgi:hypothetical protein